MSVARSLLLSCTLIGIVVCPAGPRAQGPTAAFHAIGHLPGPRSASIVRDATRVGAVIHAVGGAAARACTLTSGLCGETDTAVLWRFDGTNATLEALQDIVVNPTSTTPLSAHAITPDGAYIASQARILATGAEHRAVRVTTSSLANLLLSGVPQAAAVATSIDGTVLYGSTNRETILHARGYRFDTVTTTSIPFVSPGVDTQNPVAGRGSSANGNVAVGSSFSTTSDHKAYRYVHGSGVTAIPLLAGGTLNDARAVSPDGNLVLVTGNSTANPNGEAYLYTANTGAIQALGSPNAAWRPGPRSCATGLPACGPVHTGGGMTADGSVVALSFANAFDQYAYFHNANGWFHLTSVLGANGVDITAEGWSPNSLGIQGISSDGTLVFGYGHHNDKLEGFVAEFGPGVLAGFNPQAVTPANTSFVGVWVLDGDISAPNAVGVFTADGAYYLIESDGFEWGYYTFDGSYLTITTRLDTNGSAGISDTNGVRQGPLSITGDTLTIGDESLYRIAGGPGSIVGGWVAGDPTQPDNAFVAVFADNAYFTAQDFPDGDGVESGTYTWDPVTHELTVYPTGGPSDPGNFATLAPDGLTVFVGGDDGKTFSVARIIDPATIPAITSPQLSASGIAGQAFNFGVTATNVAAFGAVGLPDGLSINSSTGEITGTPSVGGQFAVTISATSAIGVSDIETFSLTIALPTPVGQNVVVEPLVPEGQGPITISFSEITGGGTTTVEVLDLNQVPAPGNVQVAGVVYEVTTTASFEGLITLCFSYAGINFGEATPRLFHYENNVWVDITTGVNTTTETVCGATTSLSPFAVLASNVVRTGFYAPINPVAGFLNTVKGGSTVPLKFNVFVNGVEQKTTDGLDMTMQQIHCDSNAPQDEVEQAPTTGTTSLRYDSAGFFIQNWKVPKTPGPCYMIRMLTEQDGLALTARFKVK